MNVNPVFFAILPELLSVQSRGRKEVKQWKGKVPRWRSDLNIDALKVGDVILTGVNEWGVAAPIQASNILSSSEREKDRYWCHTAIYIGDGNHRIRSPNRTMKRATSEWSSQRWKTCSRKATGFVSCVTATWTKPPCRTWSIIAKSKATGGCKYD